MTNSDLAAPLLASLYHEEYRPPFLPVLQQVSPFFASSLLEVQCRRYERFSFFRLQLRHFPQFCSSVSDWIGHGCSRNSLLGSKWGGWGVGLTVENGVAFRLQCGVGRRNALPPIIMEPSFACIAIRNHKRRTRSRSMSFLAARILRVVCAIFLNSSKKYKQLESKKRAKQVHD